MNGRMNKCIAGWRTVLLLTLSVLQQRHIRNYYNHTHLDQAYNGEVWLSITNAASLQLSGPPGAI